MIWSRITTIERCWGPHPTARSLEVVKILAWEIVHIFHCGILYIPEHSLFEISWKKQKQRKAPRSVLNLLSPYDTLVDLNNHDVFSGAIIGLSANIYATDGRDHAAVPTTAIVRLGIRHLQSGVVFQSRYEFLSSVPCRVAVIDLVFWRHLDVMRSFHIADALDLSSQAKPDVYEERNKYLSALFTCITNKLGMAAGVQKYGSLLMMTASIQVTELLNSLSWYFHWNSKTLL